MPRGHRDGRGKKMIMRRRDFVLTGTALTGWAAMGLPRPAWAASAAQTAVDAAKEFSGERSASSGRRGSRRSIR